MSMAEQTALAERFEEQRGHLRAVAWRMLGSASEADDAVQETWLRLSRSDISAVENLGGWLTTVVSRVCLDTLRTRTARREEPLDPERPEPAAGRADGSDPEYEALLTDSVGPALLLVLDTLNPAERVAFVLHDIFSVPFEDIAAIIDRPAAATRQLASRARRRVRGATAPLDADSARQRDVVSAFLTASRNGDFDALVALLDPDAVLRADPAALAMGGMQAEQGAAAVARTFSGRAAAVQMALIDGIAGATWAPGDRPRVLFAFTFADDDGTITRIDLLADPDRLAHSDVTILGKD